MSLAAPRIDKDRCRYCRLRLGGSETADGLCDTPACRNRALREATARIVGDVEARRDREDDEARRRTAPAMRAAVAALGAGEAIAQGRVPHITLPVSSVPAERRRRFEAHLDRIIAEAFGDAPISEDDALDRERDPDFARRRAAEPDDSLALNAACIACRGQCCTLGASTEAFLTTHTIAWYRSRRPEADRAAVRAAYLDRLPDRHLYESCLYHGAAGCVLPRDMRAAICNGWSCHWRKSLAAELTRTRSARSVVVAVPRNHLEHPQAGGRAIRVVTVDGDGVTIEDGHVLAPL